MMVVGVGGTGTVVAAAAGVAIVVVAVIVVVIVVLVVVVAVVVQRANGGENNNDSFALVGPSARSSPHEYDPCEKVHGGCWRSNLTPHHCPHTHHLTAGIFSPMPPKTTTQRPPPQKKASSER